MAVHAPHLWSAVRALHVLAMALFLGGQIVLVAVVLPVERTAPDPTRLRAVARRFGWASAGALVVLAATGSAMASHDELWSSPVLRLKLALLGALAVALLAHLVRPRWFPLAGLVFVLTLGIAWQGLTLAHGVG